MSSEKMVAVMRKLETTEPPALQEIVHLQEKTEKDGGYIFYRFEIMDGDRPPGYLTVLYHPESKEIKQAEFNVNFKHLIGLNRSPIQLRLSIANILKYIH